MLLRNDTCIIGVSEPYTKKAIYRIVEELGIKEKNIAFILHFSARLINIRSHVYKIYQGEHKWADQDFEKFKNTFSLENLKRENESFIADCGMRGGAKEFTEFELNKKQKKLGEKYKWLAFYYKFKFEQIRLENK